MMNKQKKFIENRRDFLRKFTLLGGMGAAGTLTGSAAVDWLRGSAPEGNGVLVRICPDPAAAAFGPLDELQMESSIPGTLVVFDGKNREYVRSILADRLMVSAGGWPGNHLVILLDEQGLPADFATFRTVNRVEMEL